MRLSVFLFAGLMLLTAAPAFAQVETPAAVTVRADDLDLSTAQGAQRMLRRLERAADRVCGLSIANSFPSQRDEFRSCRAATIATSVNQLGAPEVSAQFAERYGPAETQVADR